MARYDVYRNPSPKGRAAMPYLLDVQADVLAILDTRVVIPLAPDRPIPGVPKALQPTVLVEGQPMMVLTPLVSAMARSGLGPLVGNVSGDGPELLRALDFLLTGS